MIVPVGLFAFNVRRTADAARHSWSHLMIPCTPRDSRGECVYSPIRCYGISRPLADAAKSALPGGATPLCCSTSGVTAKEAAMVDWTQLFGKPTAS